MNINKLKEHLEKTPIEQLRKEWDEVKNWVMIEPKAQELIKLFAIPDVTKSVCDHNWKEWEDENCNAQMRCTKCKEIK